MGHGALGIRVWNVGVLGALAALWLASTQHGVRGVVPADRAASIASLEAAVSRSPEAAAPLVELATAYMESRLPGLAVAVIEASAYGPRGDAEVQHVYARALLDIGRASSAREAERSVLAACEHRGCPMHLQAAALRRLAFLDRLVSYGVEDASAEPELCAVAYEASLRDTHLATR